MTGSRKGDKRDGSLSFRVAFISILFLVIPLFIFSFVGYRMVYKTQMQHIMVTMDLLEQGERTVIDEFIKGQDQVLDLVANALEEGPITSILLQQYHNLISEHEDSQYIFFLQNGICKAASAPQLVGRDFTKFLTNRRRLKGGHDLFTAKEFFSHDETLFLAKVMPHGYLMISYPIERLLESHAIISDDDYPVNFSLLNQYNETIGSTNSAFDQQLFDEGGVAMAPIVTEPGLQLKKEINTFTFSLDGKKWAGIIKPVGDTGYQLLFAIGTKFVFLSFERFLKFVLIFFGALVVIGFPLVYLLTRRMGRPLRDLTEVMELVGRGKTHYRYETDRFGYEINRAGLVFNEMIATLLKTQRTGEEQRVAKETLAKELEIGQEVQRSLIPHTLPDIPGLKMAASYLPAKEVSGDFYDLFQREDGKWLIVMADISGKGIHACFFALLLRSMLRSFASKNGELTDIIKETNQLFSMDTVEEGVFATGWFGIYDPNNFSVVHINCGHPPTLILRSDGRIEELGNRTMSLGVEQIDHLPVETAQLQPGDQLFLFTDGLSEMHNQKNELYGEERIKEFIIKRKGQDLSETLSDLFEELAWFGEGAPQHDDLTFLLIRRASGETSPEEKEAAPDPQSPH